MKQKSLLFINSIRLHFISALLLIVSGLYAQAVPEVIPRNSAGMGVKSSTNFSAEYIQEKVILTWITEQKRTFSHFIIEKSFNGIDFKESAIVFTNDNAAFRKEYSFNDELTTNNKGVLYYRLKMVDVDQQIQRSAIRVIRIGDDLAAVKQIMKGNNSNNLL